jgi:hypothetical protein
MTFDSYDEHLEKSCEVLISLFRNIDDLVCFSLQLDGKTEH